MAAADSPLSYLRSPLPYVRRHITLNKNVFSTSLNKTCPSFLPSFHLAKTAVCQGFAGYRNSLILVTRLNVMRFRFGRQPVNRCKMRVCVRECVVTPR